MARIIRSRAADDDLFAILDYGIDRWGVDKALAFTFSFEAAEALLASHPEIGRPRPEIEAGIRSWQHRGYIIFYRYDEPLVTIIRILHGAADPGSIDDWD